MATAKGTDNVLVKKPHTKSAFTQEQIQEFINAQILSLDLNTL
jgi:hypothetical protein